MKKLLMLMGVVVLLFSVFSCDLISGIGDLLEEGQSGTTPATPTGTTPATPTGTTPATPTGTTPATPTGTTPATPTGTTPATPTGTTSNTPAPSFTISSADIGTQGGTNVFTNPPATRSRGPRIAIAWAGGNAPANLRQYWASMVCTGTVDTAIGHWSDAFNTATTTDEFGGVRNTNTNTNFAAHVGVVRADGGGIPYIAPRHTDRRSYLITVYAVSATLADVQGGNSPITIDFNPFTAPSNLLINDANPQGLIGLRNAVQGLNGQLSADTSGFVIARSTITVNAP